MIYRFFILSIIILMSLASTDDYNNSIIDIKPLDKIYASGYNKIFLREYFTGYGLSYNLSKT